MTKLRINPESEERRAVQHALNALLADIRLPDGRLAVADHVLVTDRLLAADTLRIELKETS